MKKKDNLFDSEIVLESDIVHDDYTKHVLKMYDVPFGERNVVKIKNNIKLPEKWNIGLIYGPSGSGKTTILSQFGKVKKFEWDNKAVISNFKTIPVEEAVNILSAVGFSSVPAWLRPYSVLSNGEKFRVDIARAIAESNDEPILIDEFTSVVDRTVAAAASNALNKYVKGTNKKIVLASCHADILEWLRPDWLYSPADGIMSYSERNLRRPQICLKVFRAKYEAWSLFKEHHYLSADLNKAAALFLFYWNDVPIACVCVLPFPHEHVKNAWRASRTVVLPDYQGLGIGTAISDFIGSVIKAGGGRYYSRTTHPAMIAHRTKRPEMWRVTLVGKVAEQGESSGCKAWKQDNRECYSFEYIGPPASEEDAKLFWDKTTEEEVKIENARVKATLF